jgi:DNA-binding LacI/PurR family transcriptional regulator
MSRVTARRCLKLLCREQVVVARPARGYFPVSGPVEPEELRRRRSVLFYYVDGTGAPLLDSLHAGIVNGANAEAIRLGLDLYAVSRGPSDFQRTLSERWERGLRGVLLDWAIPALAEYLLRVNVPFVVVEDDLEGLPVTSVIQDNAAGMFQALEHMFERGHRRLAMIMNDLDTIHPRQRLAAYREFLLRSGLPANPGWVAKARAGADGSAAAAAAAAAVLDCGQVPTAIFVASRGLLGGVREELSRRGLRCPQDVSLAVWGDPGVEESAGELFGTTYVTWDGAEMGRLAMRALDEMARSGRSERMVIRIGTRLVDRGSVATPALGQQEEHPCRGN